MDTYLTNKDIQERCRVKRARASEIRIAVKEEYDIDESRLPRRHCIPSSYLEKYLKSAVRKKRDALTDKSVASQGW